MMFLLGIYLAHDNPEDQECKIADLNCIALILPATKGHDEEAGIQPWGCVALAQLAENHKCESTPSHD